MAIASESPNLWCCERAHREPSGAFQSLAPNGFFRPPVWITFGEQTRVNSRECRRHPQLKLFQTGFPATLELFHPLTAFDRVRHIDDHPDEVVPVQYPTLTPMAFELLRLITGGAEMIYDFQDRF